MNKFTTTPNIEHLFKAMDTFCKAASDLLDAWVELDEGNSEEEAVLDKLNKHFPTSFSISFDDIVVEVKEWCQFVQKIDLQPQVIVESPATPNPKENNTKMKLHDFLEKVHLHQCNQPDITVRNELSMTFGGLKPNCGIDVPMEINRWYSKEDIYEWFYSLPDQSKAMMLEYYSSRLKIDVDTTPTYTKMELVTYFYDMSRLSGGGIDVTGVCRDTEISIRIDQNEWLDSPVCFVGGYGRAVKTINPDKVLQELPDILDFYFDRDSTFTVERIN